MLATGGDTDEGILVEVYRQDEDATLGTLVGEVETVETDDEARACTSQEAALSPLLDETEAEAAACAGVCSRLVNESLSTCRKLGFFAIDDVPTHVPLVVVTSGGEGWRTLYGFGVTFFEDDAVDVALAGETEPRPTIVTTLHALSSGDSYRLAVEAGLERAVPESHGTVIVQVRDCGGVRIRNVQVGLSPRPALATFFDGDAASLHPDGLRRHGTNWDGRFAGLDIDPADSPVRVAAAGLVDGAVRSLGWATVRVFPGAVSSVTLSGTRPGVDVYVGTDDLR